MTDSTRPEAQRPDQSVDGSPPDSQGPRGESETGSGRNQGPQPPNKQDSKPRKRAPPPKLPTRQKVFLWGSLVVAPVAGLYVAEQFCQAHAVSWVTEQLPALAQDALRPCVWGTYIAFAFVLATVIMDRVIRYPLHRHKARLEDPSEVESLIVEARTVEPRLKDPKKPDYYEDKIVDLEAEVKRLTELGPKGWTEYQVLSLNRLLVEFVKPDELRARAQSSLEDLEEYADDRFDEKKINRTLSS